MEKKQDQLNIDILKASIKKAANGPVTENDLLKGFYLAGFRNGELKTKFELKKFIDKQKIEQK